jgi:ATP-dependent Clp protease ATP-binding subunit ClpB
VSKLIGSPPGYVGYDEGGALTESVRRRPYQVVLFDEVEKAHHDVFNILLQVLDDGRLTDGQGKTVNFTNTIIIMTSNLGAEYINNEDALVNYDNMKNLVMNVVRGFFKPEFINRIDDIVVFNRLKKENMEKIVQIQLSQLEKRLESKDISVVFDKSITEYLAETGFDELFGARPLKRVIQDKVQNQLASFILSGKIKEKDTVTIRYENTSSEGLGEVKFSLKSQNKQKDS